MTSGRTRDMTDPGFRIVDGVLDPAETSDLLRTLEASPLPSGRAGARHLMKHPAVAGVANDPRLLAIARAFVGPSTVPYRATLFDKSNARNWLVPWHQDTALPLQERRDVPGWGPWSTKSGITYAHAPATALSRAVALRLHFDDSRADNGPLRVCLERTPLVCCRRPTSNVSSGTIRPLIVSSPLAASSPCARSSCTPRPRGKPIVRAAYCTSNTSIRWSSTTDCVSPSPDAILHAKTSPDLAHKA